MKRFNIILFITIMIGVVSCDVDYLESPNGITTPPTSGLFNDATKECMDDLNDSFFAGRFSLVAMQYWTQTAYATEDRYVFRESARENWEDFYRNLENYRKVIQLNEDEGTRGLMTAYGDNNNQIGTARIMMAWMFNIMTDIWGDIPYYAHGSDNPDFQALKVADSEEEILFPKYAKQSDIYPAILNELKEAAEMMDASQPGLDGDKIYGGNAGQWITFANSLRLRIGMKMRAIDATAMDHVNDAISAGVFTSNADNAMFKYDVSAINSSPMYRAYNVDNRSDFGISHPMCELLKGNSLNLDGTVIQANPFEGLTDPRLEVYAQENSDGNYVGMPISDNSADAGLITYESLPGSAIIDVADYEITLMEYAEVAFLLSELNDWDQTEYVNGVTASLAKWNANNGASDYLSNLPAASEETVLTQKYIALYMDAQTAWTEYRRTGFPKILVIPGTSYTKDPENGDPTKNFTFTSLIEGISDIPYRLQYPQFEQTLNGANRKEAVDALSNGDVLNSKLIWDQN